MAEDLGLPGGVVGDGDGDPHPPPGQDVHPLPLLHGQGSPNQTIKSAVCAVTRKYRPRFERAE